MGRKAVESGGKRDEIIAVAKRLFFEKGFDGVTVRTIQKEVGCEVGLFYYYFTSKNQVFDEVIDQIQEDWTIRFEALVETEGDVTERLMALFGKVQEIRDEMDLGKIHWSMESAILDRLVKTAEPFVTEIIQPDRALGEIVGAVAAGAGALAISERNPRALEGKLSAFFDKVLPESDRSPGNGGRRDISVVLL